MSMKRSILALMGLTILSLIPLVILSTQSWERGMKHRRSMWEYGPHGPFQRLNRLEDSPNLPQIITREEELMLASARTNYLFDIGSGERKVYSQNGEDGVLEYIFDNLGTKSKFYVEFGVENGEECNTRLLWEAYGWNGVLMDGSGKSKDARVIYNHFITADNVVELFRLHDIPKSFDLLSIDIDFNDYYVAKSVLKAGYRPRVVIQEINRNWGVDESFTVERRDTFVAKKCSTYWGMSQLAASRLYESFGYVPVYVEKEAVNMFFIQEDAIVNQLHGLGVTSITPMDVKNYLSPPFTKVFRRQDTTLCEKNSFIKFREHDLKQVDQPWKRVGVNGLVILP